MLVRPESNSRPPARQPDAQPTELDNPMLNQLSHRSKSRVCITVENSPNPSSVYIRLCKHRKKFSYCLYKTTSSKNYNAGKDEKLILLIKTYRKLTLTNQNLNSLSMWHILAHGHFVCACAKRIEEHEFGAICYFERAPRGFLTGDQRFKKELIKRGERL